MKIVLPNGFEIDRGEARKEPTAEEQADDILSIEERKSALVQGGRSDGTSLEFDVGSDDVVEVTFEDGSRWFLGNDELEELRNRNSGSSRGGAGRNDTIIFDDALFADEHSRGVIGSTLQKLRVLVVKLRDELFDEDAVQAADEDSPSAADHVRSLVIDPVAFGIARKLEKRLIGRDGSRFCQVSFTDQEDGSTAFDLIRVDSVPDPGTPAAPTLVLLHGTLSSTEGSFGDLWKTRQEELSRLRKHFGDRIFAFEHRTLTESPVDNALQIAKALPQGIEIHVLSHSRGGLVGELLCRGTREGSDAFLPEEQEMFKVQRDADRERFDLSAKVFAALKEHYAEELAKLFELNKVLGDLDLTVKRFVRVGCPARGTTLASGRLHRWSNRSFNAIGLITGQTLNPLYRAFESFTLGMLKANSKAEVLPGLQAQMPGSALIHMLNHGDTRVKADLAIVAGDLDARGGFNWKRIPIWFTDRFYGGENDLVVNTASMDGGSARQDGIRLLRVEGEHVNHFSYFANADSCNQLVSYLVGARTPRFKQIERLEEVTIPRSRTPGHLGDRPVLLLLPGLLGSELKKNDERVWAHPGRLLKGQMTELHVDAEDVTAGDVMELAYGRFIAEFGQTHDVHTAPYDWRRSLSDSAALLSIQLQEIIDAQSARNSVQPIRIVAHSMGGLVARVMMARQPEIWAQVMSRPGSRMIMAGTPTNGSYAINQMLSGEMKLIKLLALADLRNTRRDITDMAATFPGIAGLLPGFGEHEWLTETAWQDMAASASAKDWSPIAASLVNAARKERQRLLDTPLDPSLISYVAGQADRTAVDSFFDPTRDGAISFRYSREGDGLVPWKEGIPVNLTKVFYQPSVHGSLLDAPEHFDAWRELLESGVTRRLPNHAPNLAMSRGVIDPNTIEAEPDVIDYLPDRRTLLELALGMEPHGAEQTRPAGSIEVSVVHGDLAFACHPVAVGHYEGEGIVGAEEALDRVLGRRLSERHLIGQYPGPIGSSEVVFATSQRGFPEGALVIGLGMQGELSAAALERSLTAGFINYLLEIRDWWSMRSPETTAPSGVKLTTLLIGTGIGSLSVSDSVGVILGSAKAANQTCSQANGSNDMLIDGLVLVELWQDLALQAVEATVQWASMLDGIVAAEDLVERAGGQQRSYFKASPDWWHTISVRQGESSDEYVFDDYTRAARNELTREPIDSKFVDRFVDQIIRTTGFDKHASSSPHHALFELLLPATIKGRTMDSDKLRLILDDNTAHIPWEMLIDGWSRSNEPLAVSKHMIRQLSVEQFRNAPDPARGRAVLVVGDPPSGSDPYPALPAARSEALAVVEAFEKRGRFEVIHHIADKQTPDNDTGMAVEIIKALYSSEFRILHFAGHGSYYRQGAARDDGELDEEGLVIGEGLRLTPTLVEKMRKTPALVFLNCCHLGHVEQRDAQGTVRFNHIAANLATQFIRMGTCAVVAAGWEIDDAAAACFASVFHEHMLGNATLADSVFAARTLTFKKFPKSNTFGAYQCWGDPEFRLDPVGGLLDRDEALIRYASPSRYALEANNIRHEALSASEERCAVLTRKADLLLTSMVSQYGDPWDSPDTRDSDWRAARVGALASLGRAQGELGDLPSAIRLLRIAYRLDASELSVKDLEQLGSFECRYSACLPRDRSAASRELAAEFGTPMELLKDARNRLSNVLEQHLASGRKHGHRDILCLVASGAKREAMLLEKTKTARLRKVLRDMRHYYGCGWSGEQMKRSSSATIETYIHQAAMNREEPDDYSFGNFALACIVLRWYEKSVDRWPEAFVELVRRYTTSAQADKERAGDFWTATRGMESMILQFLDSELDGRVGPLGEIDAIAERVVTHFRNVNRRFGSSRQWAIINDHIAFADSMLARKPVRDDKDNARIEGLRKVCDVVTDFMEE